VKEFDTRFNNLHSHISKVLGPPEAFVLLIYLNSFEGQFSFILKKKIPKILAEDKEYSAQVEEHLIISRLILFSSIMPEKNQR
jgi:hypothetical protein